MLKYVFAIVFIIFVNYFEIILGHVLVKEQKAEPITKVIDSKEQALLEIKILRQEISVALEKDEEQQNAQRKDVITQPEWTKKELHSDLKNENKVNSLKTYKEVELVRMEIANAVSKNKYAIGRRNESHLVAQADHYLGMKFRMKNFVSDVVAKAGERKEEFFMDQIEFGQDYSELNSNLIEGYNFSHDGFEEYHLIEMKFKRRENDILILKSIDENLNFKIDGEVTEWRLVKDMSRNWLVGIKLNSLLVFYVEDMFITQKYLIKFEENIRYFDTFSTWILKKQTSFIVVATNDIIQWFQISNVNTPFYTVKFSKPIRCFNFFQIEDRQYIAVSLDQSSNLMIYEINLTSKELWIVQKIPLKNATSEIVILDTGRDIIMGCIQNDFVLVYISKPKTDLGGQIHFVLLKNYFSKNVETITGFQMGGYTYIAFGGLNPRIIRYNRGHFVTQTIFGHNFGFVSLFFPIPVRTYRDDLILLVQHQIEFETHNLTVLETLIWNGKDFFTGVPVPCKSNKTTIGFGIGCMLDEQRISGIKGSVMLQNEGFISIIVPRFKENSRVFKINIELLSKNTETKDLEEIFDFLKDWFNEQESIVNKSLKLINSINSNSNTLHVTKIEIVGKLDQIYINDNKLTSLDNILEFSDLIDDLEHIQNEISELYFEDQMIRNRRQSGFSKIVKNNIKANDMNIKKFNTNMVLIDKGNLKFDGKVQLNKDIIVKKGSSMEIIENNYSKNLNTLLVKDNINLVRINDIKWNHIVSKLLMRSSAFEIPQLQIEGEARFEKSLHLQYLNTIKFPEHYLWANEQTSSVIRAKKLFLKTLSGNAVDTEDSINGVYLFDVLTLSDSHRIPGLTTFSQLEVSERLEVNGTVQAKYLDMFLPNPSIVNADFIQSKCQFGDIHIFGSLIILDSLDHATFNSMLKDVVLKTDLLEVRINSNKSFPKMSVVTNSVLNLISNAINTVQLYNFVEKNSDQVLKVGKIKGNIFINYLRVQRHFDKINITEIANKAIKINENKIISSVIIFNKETVLTAQEMHIVKLLNNNTVQHFFTFNKNIIPFITTFSRIRLDNLKVQAEIQGKGTIINNKNVKSLRSIELFDFPKPIDETVFYINHLFLKNDLIVDKNVVFKFFEKIENLAKMITAGQINIKKLMVYGDVIMHQINSQLCSDLETNVIWLNRHNFIHTNVMFFYQVNVNNLLKIQQFNKLNFLNYIADIVFQTNITDKILARKRLTGTFQVYENVKIKNINTIPFIRFANKKLSIHFKGQLQILGDISVQQIDTKCCLNQYNLKDLKNLLQYNDSLRAFVINGIVKMKKAANIKHLYLKTIVSLIKNVDEFVSNLVDKDNICVLKGKTIFKNAVIFQKSAYIGKLNGLSLKDFYSNIVFNNGSKIIQVKAPIKFINAIAAKIIYVKDILYTTNFMGFSLDEMINNSLKLDEIKIIHGHVNFQPESINGNKFLVGNLNGYPTSQLWTLNCSQNFTEAQQLQKTYLNGTLTSLTGLVNGFNSFNELKNTLLTLRNQHVTAPTTIQSFRVLHNLETLVEINYKNLSHIATLFEDLTFKSPLSFNCINTNIVHSDDEITGIMFSDWYKNSLWSYGRAQQFAEENWVFQDIEIKGDTTIYNRINELQLQDFPKTFSNTSAENSTILDLKNDCRVLCHMANQLIVKSKPFVYYLKFFKESYQLKEEKSIYLIKFFELNNKIYMLNNAECFTKVFTWKNQTLRSINNFKSGIIDKILAIPTLDERALNLIITTNINSQKLCNVQGGNIWKFQENMVFHLKTFDESGSIKIIHQSSSVPSNSFYGLDETRQVVTEFSLTSENKQNSWNISGGVNNAYHFLPSDAELGLALSDGKRIFVINQSKEKKSRQIPSPAVKFSLSESKKITNLHLPSFIRANKTDYNNNVTPSINNTDLNTKFDDHIIHIMKDLVNKINKILNDTHLDFFEEYGVQQVLCRDFIDILEELKKQNMFLKSENFQFHTQLQNKSNFENLGELYIIKTVMTLWSHLKEVEEVYLHNNSMGNGIIMKYLLNEIKEILAVSDFQNGYSSHDKTNEITKQIKKLKDNIIVNLPKNVDDSPFKLNERLIGQPILARNFFTADSPYLPNRNSGEVLTLKVGSPENRRNFIVTVVPKNHLVGGNYQNFVHIYYDIIQGELYQSIPAHKPRSLTAMHIGDETILAYIEDKYIVRAFIFRGVQGFVKFSNFKSQRYVTAMTSVTRRHTSGCPQHFLVLNIEKTVVFHEAIMIGKCSVVKKFNCSELC